VAPRTEPELAERPGVGTKKLERYGRRFLAAIAAASEAGGPAREPAGEVASEPSRAAGDLFSNS
jgi:hypothetical protein